MGRRRVQSSLAPSPRAMPDQNNRVLRRPSQPRQPDDLLPALIDFAALNSARSWICCRDSVDDSLTRFYIEVAVYPGPPLQDRPRRQKHETSKNTLRHRPSIQVASERASLRIAGRLLRRARLYPTRLIRLFPAFFFSLFSVSERVEVDHVLRYRANPDLPSQILERTK